MANTLNLPLSGGGGSTGDLTFVGYFDTYALLPAVADADDLAYVRTTTGVFLINRNKKGRLSLHWCCMGICWRHYTRCS